jgi:hypothetical protein
VPDKLEVLPGPGLVARFGEVVVWAGPQASTGLQAHLVAEARRAAQAPQGGDQVANSLIAVLQRGDPEPQSPFAVVGPGPGGSLTLFLHGPVQAWDSGRWLAPQPVPGWMTAQVGRPWPLIVIPYGASPPPQSQQGNPLDLVAGVVPGSGFVLLRPPSAPSTSMASASGAAGAVTSPTLTPAPGGPAPSGFGPSQSSQSGPTASGQTASGQTASGQTAAPSTISTSPLESPSRASSPAPAGYAQAPSPAGLGATGALAGGVTAMAGPAPLDLRHVLVPSSPPLPLASTASQGLGQDRPEATGVYCDRGHFNHPGSARCLRCGRTIAPGTPATTGPRPPVGALLADDGSIWVLDKNFIVGSDPAAAPEVRGGTARAIKMRAGANHVMAAVQAEVRVSGWDAYLVDRGAEGGTYWQGPGAQSWVQLSRGGQRDLVDGSHISCGGRVLTFLSCWPSRAAQAPGAG